MRAISLSRASALYSLRGVPRDVAMSSTMLAAMASTIEAIRTAAYATSVRGVPFARRSTTTM